MQLNFLVYYSLSCVSQAGGPSLFPSFFPYAIFSFFHSVLTYFPFLICSFFLSFSIFFNFYLFSCFLRLFFFLFSFLPSFFVSFFSFLFFFVSFLFLSSSYVFLVSSIHNSAGGDSRVISANEGGEGGGSMAQPPLGCVPRSKPLIKLFLSNVQQPLTWHLRWSLALALQLADCSLL